MRNQTIQAKVKAFSCESVARNHKISVSEDGTVRVWDDVAGHYTTVHALSQAAKSKIRNLAAK